MAWGRGRRYPSTEILIQHNSVTRQLSLWFLHNSRVPLTCRLVRTRTAEQCRVRCRSISALNPDKKKGAFNEVWQALQPQQNVRIHSFCSLHLHFSRVQTEDNLLKKITMVLIRNEVPGSPQKQHYMALSAGFTNTASAGTGRKRKNAGGKSESGNDEFWSYNNCCGLRHCNYCAFA